MKRPSGRTVFFYVLQKNMAATGVTAKIGIVYLSVWVWEYYCRCTMCNNKKTNKTINTEFHPLVSMGVFLKVVKKIFELDALIDNTFKENSEKLGRKVLKLRLRAVKIR